MSQQLQRSIQVKQQNDRDSNSLKEPSDCALLAQFKAGDEEAFRTLVNRYTRPLYNLAFRFLRDPMEAENVTQESFLRVVGALDRLRLDAPFKPYLFRITVNLCRDLAHKKHPLHFSDLYQTVGGEDGADSVEVSEAIEDSAAPLWKEMLDEELREQLRTAIDELPMIYRAVVTLRYTEEFSYEEIARALHLSVNTVRTHLRRAKIRLRTAFERDLKPIRSQVTVKVSSQFLLSERQSAKAA